MANVNIPSPVEFVADNNEDVIPEAARAPDDNISHGASVLRKFIEDLEKSDEGAKEVGMFRHWVDSMVDDGIEEGLDMKDRHYRTLLHVAAIEGLFEIAKRLIDKGAVLDARDEWGDTPLIDACGEGDGGGKYLKVVKLLLDKGAKADICGNENESPLYRAAINGHSLIVQYLLANVKWDLDFGEDIYNMTPLHAAASAEDSDMVRYLRDKGARLDLRDTDGWTPLMTAIASQREDATEELLRRRDKEDLQLEAEDLEGLSPMLRASKDGFSNGFRLLMEAGADVNVRGRDGQQPLHLASLQGNKTISELILRTGKCNHVHVGDDAGMTPLHLACAGEDDDGQYNEVIRLMLDQTPKPYTEVVIKEIKIAVELAFENGHDERGETILDVFDPEISWTSDAFMWAAGETKRHRIATSLVKRQLNFSARPTTERLEGWTAIEWAAFATEPQALWLLIANSPQNRVTKEALKSAKDIVEKLKNKNLDQLDDTAVRKTQEVRDIIDNPPTGLLCAELSLYSRPKYDHRHISSLESYEATIVPFYKRDMTFDRIMMSPTIKEIIYRQGPVGIMDKMVDRLRELTKVHSSGLGEVCDFQRPFLVEPHPEPEFTWIHLPATNMIWMDHLLQTIMVDTGEEGSRYNQVKSFLQNSWTELPNKASASRIMRPQFVSGNTRESADGGVMGRQDTKRSKGMDVSDACRQVHMPDQNGESTATAIYMPYLTYSFQYGGECNDDKPEDNVKLMSSQSPERPREKPATTDEAISKQQKAIQSGRKKKAKHNKKTEHKKGPEYAKRLEHKKGLGYTKRLAYTKRLGYTGKLQHAKRLEETKRQYESLLDEYTGNVIHGSSTLDESYYHFGEDRRSTEDKTRRNRSQVATDIWREQNFGPTWREQELGSYWLLVRVNQLWIWTINNKWLIFASSHPIDDDENELLNDILDHLQKQREAGGGSSQPGSTAEMSQLIVDYCVDSYERQPSAHDDERPEDCKMGGFPSIRQVFLKSLSSIERDEAYLFDRFSELRERLRSKSQTGSAENNQISLDDQLAEATREAEKLSRNVRDILDELSMLQATVQYQENVQKTMNKQSIRLASHNGTEDILETSITATDNINDIKRLTIVAERILATIDTTLSLHQSEIANLQAGLAMQEGRVLMVFTVVTILFLPMSFLTSLFALDVASFQQAPPWAFGVIVSASFGFFIPMVIFAFTWERSIGFVIRLISKLVPSTVSQWLEHAMENAQRLIRGLAGASHQTQGDGGKHSSELGRSEASCQAKQQTPASSTNFLGVRMRPKRSTTDEEKGFGSVY